MERHIDFERYQKFVDAVTSDASTDFVALSDRLVALDEKGANIERLLTAGVGINACLLYTSPSPRDRTRSRMPSSA